MARLKSILGFVNWRSYLWAVLLATIAKFIVYALTGNEPLASGSDALPEASPLVQNGVAAVGFLIVGYVFYGLLYVLFVHNASGFARSTLWDRLTKASVAALGMAFIAVISMPWFFTIAYTGPDPRHPEIAVDWQLLPWEYGIFWEYLLIYFAFALVMAFVYKSPAQKQPKRQRPDAASPESVGFAPNRKSIVRKIQTMQHATRNQDTY